MQIGERRRSLHLHAMGVSPSCFKVVLVVSKLFQINLSAFLHYDTEMAVSERVVAGNSNKVECTYSLSNRAVSEGGRNPNRPDCKSLF